MGLECYWAPFGKCWDIEYSRKGRPSWAITYINSTAYFHGWRAYSMSGSVLSLYVINLSKFSKQLVRWILFWKQRGLSKSSDGLIHDNLPSYGFCIIWSDIQNMYQPTWHWPIYWRSYFKWQKQATFLMDDFCRGLHQPGAASAPWVALAITFSVGMA